MSDLSDAAIMGCRKMLKDRLNVSAAFFDDCVTQAIFLAEGCAQHPAYRAKRKPRADCWDCWRLWLMRAPDDKKDEARMRLSAWPKRDGFAE